MTSDPSERVNRFFLGGFFASTGPSVFSFHSTYAWSNFLVSSIFPSSLPARPFRRGNRRYD